MSRQTQDARGFFSMIYLACEAAAIRGGSVEDTRRRMAEGREGERERGRGKRDKTRERHHKVRRGGDRGQGAGAVERPRGNFHSDALKRYIIRSPKKQGEEKPKQAFVASIAPVHKVRFIPARLPGACY